MKHLLNNLENFQGMSAMSAAEKTSMDKSPITLGH